jgi:KDO2-lipid IV(A) lauroyltransferase
MLKKISTSRRIRYWLEYILARSIFALFRVIGRKRASLVGGWIGRKVGPFLSAHKTAVDNIARAMPELSDEDRKAALKGMWTNLGRNAAEIPFVREFSINDEDVEFHGSEHLDEFLKSGKPALFITGHYGPWEATMLAGQYCKVDVSIVYRAANNPMVEKYVQKERQGVGYKFVPKGKTGARAIIKALKNNEPVALLNDQKQNSGVSVPFFGRDAKTATAVADFACRMNLPVYPIRSERTADDGIKVTVYPAIYAPSDGDPQQNVLSFLTTINEIYEEWIRERPDHWFWVHNRW